MLIAEIDPCYPQRNRVIGNIYTTLYSVRKDQLYAKQEIVKIYINVKKSDTVYNVLQFIWLLIINLIYYPAFIIILR